MGVDFPFLSTFRCSFWRCAVLHLFPASLQVSGALPTLSSAWWPVESLGPRWWGLASSRPPEEPCQIDVPVT